MTPWKTKCRCGASLVYSCEDVQTNRPADGADYWCVDPRPESGPHDWGVIVYQDGTPQAFGPQKVPE